MGPVNLLVSKMGCSALLDYGLGQEKDLAKGPLGKPPPGENQRKGWMAVERVTMKIDACCG